MSSPASQDTLTITAPVPQGCEHILTEQAKGFVAELVRRFGPRRVELLENRKRRMDASDRRRASGFPSRNG